MKKDKLYYLKLCKRALQDIARLQGKDPEAFIRLRKKAKHYLELAKKF